MRQIRGHLSEAIRITSENHYRNTHQRQSEWLERLTLLLRNRLGVSFGLIFNFDREDEKALYYCSCSLKCNDDLANLTRQISYRYASGLQKGRAMLFNGNTLNLPRATIEIVQKYHINTILLTKVPVSDTSSGILCLYNSQKDYPWTEREPGIIEDLIEQAYQLFKLEKNQPYQELINEIIYYINYQKINHQILNYILQRIGEVFNYAEVAILKEDNNEFKINQYWCAPYLENRFNDNFGLSLPDNGWEYVRQWCNYNCLDYQSHDDEIFVSLPIFAEGELWGGLLLTTRCLENEEICIEVKYLELVVEQISTIISKIKQEELITNESKATKINEFLSHMTHELRAPLSGVLGFARMLQEQIYGSLNEKQLQYVNAIATSGEHLLALVNDFLDLSKIEANYEELFIEKLAVEDLCRASLSIIRCKAEEQKLDLRLDIAEDIDFCFADQQRIKQILVNLLSNAIKFTEKGSVILKVEKIEQYLAFSVIDTGIGIPEEEQKRLFQPFIQLNNSLSRKHKGTGLGLALSKKLALLHGGDIILISQPGKGSCFRLQIPHPYMG